MSRARELEDDVRRALEALGFAATSPAHDAWLDAAALAQALDAGQEPCVRAASVLAGEDEGFGGVPADGWWLRLRPELRAAPLRGGTVRTLAARRVVLRDEIESCCDHVKCERMRSIATLVLELDGDPAALVLGEAAGDDAASAGGELAAVGERVAKVLGVPFEGPAAVEPAGAAEPLEATVLARWSLRREADLFVLRDHASLGPRASAPLEIAATVALGLGAVAAAWAAIDAWQHAAYQRLSVSGAIVFVLAVACYAMTHIARHSWRYRAPSTALLYLARDRLVVAPWLARSGAVDRKPEGRYGAAVRLAEVHALTVLPAAGGHTLRYDTEHDAYDLGTLASEEAARRWCAALERLRHRVAHVEALESARSPLRAAIASALVLLAIAGCSPHAEPVPQPAPSVTFGGLMGTSLPDEPPRQPSPTSSAAVEPAPKPAIDIVEDDVPRALERAKKDGKALFVEVWAPWCHTCLSMKSFVLPDPAVVALGDRVVFAAVDSDRPDNTDFMTRYVVNVWPTLFVLDSKDGAVLGMWQGAASAEELRRFVTESVDSRDAATDPSGPLAALMTAKRAHAGGKFKDAAGHYKTALERGGDGWPRRSEALYGLLFTEYRQGHWAECARLGSEHAASIEGAAIPADFCSTLLECAEKVTDATEKRRAQQQAVERLRRHTESPPANASVDDRSDALSLFADALQATGDKAGARRAIERQLELLEHAAAAAPSVEAAATFDYARMNAYLSLGKGEQAVAMLRERTAQQPDNYEPHARLGQTLLAMKRPADALAPLEKAVEKSYGPRRLRYLEMVASAHAALKHPADERAALERLLAEWQKLEPDQRNDRRNKALADGAKKRLKALPPS